MNKEFINALVDRLNEIILTTYDRAPTDNTYPFAVLNSLSTSSPNEDEKQTMFYVDLYSDENSGTTESAAAVLADKCDAIYRLDGTMLTTENLFIKLQMSQQKDVHDSETDLIHRQVSGMAKIFILGGN